MNSNFKIVSGGQTGVDRAALDVAITLGIPHGGWCPKGRKAEDGPLPTKYHLQETPTSEYVERTEWNVRDSDATLILTLGEPKGGTLYTIDMAQKHHKPYTIIQLPGTAADIATITDWLKHHNVKTLNIAGPRASQEVDVYGQAYQFLKNLFLNIDFN